MIALNHLTIHKVTGADAGSFLHDQLAADTAALTVGEACFAAYCSPRGQVIALLLVIRQEFDWLIVTETSLSDVVTNRLRMFVLRAQVEIEKAPGLQLAGVSSEDFSLVQSRCFTPANLTLCYMLTTPGEADKTAVMVWRREEIKSGVTWLNSESSEQFLPQMLGMDSFGAVSFSKGCFPGQEIIARTRYLGKLKRKPALLEAEGQPELVTGVQCLLRSDDKNFKAVVIEAVCPEGDITTLMVVARMESDELPNLLEVEGLSYPVRRISQG